MSSPIKVVAVSGSLGDPSKTTVLLQEILDRLAEVHPIESRLITLTEVGPHFAGALSRAELSPVVEEQLQAIESADLLVVASPVYRASFTGLFKHLFDFVDQYALVDTPVLLAASGGSERHALIIEHQFRPLFAFFQALTLPLGIYAHDSDFTDYRVTSRLLSERIEKSIVRALPLVRGNVEEKRAIRAALAEGAAEVVPERDHRAPVRLYS